MNMAERGEHEHHPHWMDFTSLSKTLVMETKRRKTFQQGGNPQLWVGEVRAENGIGERGH